MRDRNSPSTRNSSNGQYDDVRRPEYAVLPWHGRVVLAVVAGSADLVHQRRLLSHVPRTLNVVIQWRNNQALGLHPTVSVASTVHTRP